MKFKKSLLLLVTAGSFLPYSAPALLMRESGPEPIIVQVKESLRQSDDLDSELAKLASVERASSVAVEKRWAGAKYLELQPGDAIEVNLRYQDGPDAPVAAVAAMSPWRHRVRAVLFVLRQIAKLLRDVEPGADAGIRLHDSIARA